MLGFINLDKSQCEQKIAKEKNAEQKSSEQKALEQAFRDAAYFQEVRIGERFLFYRSFIRVKYVALERVERAHLRVETGESGDLPTQAVYLVLMLGDGQEVKLHMERYDTAKKMFDYLKEKHPRINCSFAK